ncbi:MAG: hypothetical protein PVI59_02770 [Anaerolineae bacterium]|jgi:uncharacterized spore protein YtfJ
MNVQTETVRGEPLVVEGHRIVPVARRTVGVWRKATIGTGVAGMGGAFARLRPVGVRIGEGREARLLPIHDRTQQVLWIMVAVAIVVPLLLIIAARMARR